MPVQRLTPPLSSGSTTPKIAEGKAPKSQDAIELIEAVQKGERRQTTAYLNMTRADERQLLMVRPHSITG